MSFVPYGEVEARSPISAEAPVVPFEWWVVASLIGAVGAIVALSIVIYKEVSK